MTRELLVLALVLTSSSALAQPRVRQGADPAPSATTDPPTPTDEAAEEQDVPHAWETPVIPVRRNAILVYPWSLINRGLVATYERAMPDARFSLAARTSLAFPAGGDYRSIQIGFSIDARYYPLAKGPFTRWEERAPVGLFLGLRVGVLVTRLTDRRNDRVVGTAERFLFETTLGYRFTIASRVEISPYVGALFYSDRVAGFSSTLRPTASFGFSVGVLF